MLVVVARDASIAKAGASGEEINSAAQRAEAHEFITALEDNKDRGGYRANAGERGVQLRTASANAISRIFLKYAPIVIVDEARSALRSKSKPPSNRTLSP